MRSEGANAFPIHWTDLDLTDPRVFVRTGVEPFAGMRPYYSTGSVTRDSLEPEGRYSWSNRPSRAARQGRTGDVLQARMKDTNKALFVSDRLSGALFSTGFFQLRLPAELRDMARLFYWYLKSPMFLMQRDNRATGSTQVALTDGNARGIRLPIAPLRESARIADALESYFTRLDDAVGTLERVQLNLKRYRTSVLKAAVEGRLVSTEAELARAEGREYEPASVLLERVLAERRRCWEEAELAKMRAKGKVPKDDKWKAKYEEPTAPDVTTLQSLPEGWMWATLAQLFVTITDGDHQPPPQSAEGVPFLVIGNVKAGRVDLSGTRFVPQEYYDSLDEPRKPREGDLLYTVTGSYGIPVRVVNEGPFCVQRHIAILRPTAQSNQGYLYYVLQSQDIFEQATRKATGTAQKTLGLRSLRDFVVPFPPSSEQDRILASLEDHFSLVDNTASLVRASVLRSSRLRQSILKWAFDGKLVAQDSTDEPATHLLERIMAEQESLDREKPPIRGRRKVRSSTA